MATREGHLDTVKQLKELNCDITACNKVNCILVVYVFAHNKHLFYQHCLQHGLTAVDLALQIGSEAMVAALLD